MKGKRRALGRGLEALIPSTGFAGEVAVGATREHQQALRVPIREVRSNPLQPRTRFPETELKELAASIRQHGILQPLLVREVADGYELIAGERRLRAAPLAGLSDVPVIVRRSPATAPRDQLALSLIENLQRADLNPIEEARALKRLTDEFAYTQEEAAQELGKGRVAVANSIRLLALPERALQALQDGLISAGHGRALLALPSDPDRERALDAVLEGNFTVRQAEELARKYGAAQRRRSRATRSRRGLDPQTAALEDAMRQALGTKVLLTRLKNGGRIVIEFYSDAELDAIFTRLVGTHGGQTAPPA
jgi:ParB family chromosome partitioning protein